MLPLLVAGGVIGVGALATWLLSDSNPETILEKNFVVLGNKLNENTKNEKLIGKKKILILGQPGAGKSSLLWSISDKKCNPKPNIGQNTDATNWHKKEMTNEFFTFYKDEIFVDIPGYGTSNHPYDSYVKFFPFPLFDLTIFVVKDKIKEADEKIMKHLREVNKEDYSKNLLIVQTFSERKTDEDKKSLKKDMNKYFNAKEEGLDVIFASSRTKEGIDTINYFINK